MPMLILQVAMAGVSPFIALLHSTRPDYLDIPVEVRPLYAEFLKARHVGDHELVHSLYFTLASDERLSNDQRTYFSLLKAQVQSGNGEPSVAIETLREIVRLRTDNEEVRFLVDLEIAYFMSQTGASPTFHPTIEEVSEQFNRIFSLYDTHRIESIEARFEYARECISESQKGSDDAHYADIALEQLRIAEKLLREVKDQYESRGENPPKDLVYLMKDASGTLRRYTRARNESLPPDEKRTVRGPNTPTGPGVGSQSTRAVLLGVALLALFLVAITFRKMRKRGSAQE